MKHSDEAPGPSREVELPPAGLSHDDNPTQPDRNAEPVSGEQPPRLPFPVVGIGASAGGLEAYIEFLQAMPADSGMAFVLVQHLSPQHESLVAELLSKHTSMCVYQILDGMAVERDCVYVIRPGYTLTIEAGQLRLGESLLSAGHSRPVDDFFRSLAAEQRERAIAIIMSGMGSNGTAGAEAVKAVGGACIAQEPESAKYPSMPRHLIDAGLADVILHPKEMPQLLQQYAAHPYMSGEARELPEPEERHVLSEILTVIRARQRHDFSGYKRATVVRRIERRMGLRQVTNMGEYARILRQNPAEVTALSDDLMIHVTGFFRDPEVWETLREKVIDPLVAEREDGGMIRAWVTACSSGEEAYTLAILLLEAAERAGKHFDIKVFATDTAERSLHVARAGVFPGGIETEVSHERLARFFDKEDACYRVKKPVRELVVFAPQNLLQDPPFSRLDICTCRNLLIYLEPEVQRRVMSLLHFGLREGGALMLGTSETAGGNEELFEPIDKKARLFRRVGPTRHGSIEFPPPHALHHTVERHEMAGTPSIRRVSVAQATHRILLERYTPAAVVIDRNAKVMYFHGRTDLFLVQPAGEPTRELLLLARETIRGVLRQAIRKAVTESRTVTLRDGFVQTDEGRKQVLIKIAPLEDRPVPVFFIVSFHELPLPAAPEIPTGSQEDSTELAEQLQRARDELQSTIEELQTSNEEMKASHEEITSFNEELQSSNEELETSKEELQSLNEELTTVNAQLQAKMEELERTTNDLASLLSSTDIGVIFLDSRFRIGRFTPPVRDLIELIPSDIGRPLNDMARKFNDPQLMEDAQLVLDRLVPMEREVASAGGRWYARKALPYRTSDNRIEGVVVTFVDITEREAARTARNDAEEKLKVKVEEEHAARALAEAASAAKDAFLANVSHELRTPLSAILLWSKMLSRGGLDGERLAEGLAAISKSADAQRKLVEDLLDTARIAAGKLRLESQPVDLPELIRSAIGAIALTVENKQIELDVDVPESLGVVRADADRLRQVLWNLLSNAVKFTPPRGRVSIHADREGDMVRINVSDTGRGVSKDALNRIFDRFVQSDRTDASRGGLGLGLSIARQLVEVHGGTIDAASEGAGRGTHFRVQIPLALIMPTPTESRSAGNGEALRDVRTLVVEDDQHTRDALAAMLRAEGADVTAVAGSEEAIDAYVRHRPELIVSDIAMPGMDGLELMRRIRAAESQNAWPAAAAIACTACSGPADRERACDAGFQAFLPKPVDPDHLLLVALEQLKAVV